jgi:hypothetical protein
LQQKGAVKGLEGRKKKLRPPMATSNVPRSEALEAATDFNQSTTIASPPAPTKPAEKFINVS